MSSSKTAGSSPRSQVLLRPGLRVRTTSSKSFRTARWSFEKRSFGDPDFTLTLHGSAPRTAASLKDVGLTDVIKAAIDEYVQHGG